MSNYIGGIKTVKLFFTISFVHITVLDVSSSEPLGSKDVLIVYTCSGVRPSVAVRPFVVRSHL